jgi:hypothetical protein
MMEARALRFEWYPRAWIIYGGLYTHVWGIGLHMHACSVSFELDISLGPASLHMERFF